MSAWWDAQKILSAGFRAPFDRRRVTNLVLLVFVLPIFAFALCMWILRLGAWGGTLGSMSFDPEMTADPALIQHIIWFLLAPNAPWFFMLILFPFFVWAQAVWLNGEVTLRVSLWQWSRMMGVLR